MKLSRPAWLTKASATLGVAVVVGAVLAPGAAGAADDYTNIFEATAGRLMENLGLSSHTSSKDINYQERPPLVIPSNQTLPPPEKVDTAANPAWPKDPDVAHRKQREKEEANRQPGEAYLRERNPLPPDQLAPGPRPRGVHAPAPESPPTLGALLSPSELGYKSGGLFGKLFHWGKDDPESVKFTGEPARTSLTEPPPGYQTPSPDQPYGVGPPPPAKPEDSFYKSKELPTGE
jgi:hypothetical protein